MSSQYVQLPQSGGGSGVSSLNSLTGALTLVAGTGISVTPSGSNITIATTGAGSGTVTSVSVVSANGFAGTVANATTTPALTLSTSITGILKGNGTAISAATAGTDYVIPSGSITGTAANITATSNSTITTLSALSLPYSQITGAPAGGITALTGDVTASGSGSVAATLAATSNGTLTTLSALTTASSLASVGTITSGTWNGTTVALNYGGTGKTTQQDAINALTGTQSAGTYLRSDGTNATLSAIQGPDLPKLNPTLANQWFTYFDDFFDYQTTTNQGPLNLWMIASGTGATNQRGNGTASNPGVQSCTPGSASSTYYVIMSSIQSTVLGGGAQSLAASLNLAATPNGTNDYIIQMGYQDNWPTVNNGCFFLIDRTVSTTNWQCVTAKGGTRTTTDSGVAFASGAYHNFRIEVNAAGTSIAFYIDGSLVATNTTNIPTGVIGPVTTGRWVAGSAVTHSYDWMCWQYQTSSSRGTF